jgi:hypothetical protein
LQTNTNDIAKMGRYAMKPTIEQIKYATDLLRKLGYDVADYDFEKMTRAEVSDLIDELKDEYEG